MLVITRDIGEVIRITLPDRRIIRIKIGNIYGNDRRILIDAPRDVQVDREELAIRKDREGVRRGL